LELRKAEELIRYVTDEEILALLSDTQIKTPESLKKALYTFYVGATIKYLVDKDNQDLFPSDLVYCFLCHISQKKNDHSKAYEVIRNYVQYLGEGLNESASEEIRSFVEMDLRNAYNDLAETIKNAIPPFDDVWNELQGFITGTDIQILNSNNEALNQPRYDRRYNILIGGNKLARGVTIDNLLVTYYGRQTKRATMDTMLQHARMYGYRGRYLDVTRLFVTPTVEERFRLINESEQALRDVIEQYPNEEYRGIVIGKNIVPTRRNVLNANNIGVYAAGKSYFPRMPLFRRSEVESSTQVLNQKLDVIYPSNEREPIKITLDEMIELVGFTKSNSSGSGLWNDNLIITSLRMLRNDPSYANTGYLVVRRNRDLTNQKRKMSISVLC
jgi:Z1 domain.